MWHHWGMIMLILVLAACRPGGKKPLMPDDDKSNTNSSDQDSGAAAAALRDAVVKLSETHCVSCHGGDQQQGGVGAINDLEQLIAQDLVTPGSTDRSSFYQVLARGSMPPAGALTEAEIAPVAEWITAGASTGLTLTRPFIKESQVYTQAANDLLANYDGKSTASEVRYFSLVNMFNAGVSNNELEAGRQALAKMLNSLSTTSTIKQPEAINESKTIYRIEIDDYGWNNDKWEALVRTYPYVIVPSDQSALGVLQEDIGTTVPLVRVDWFIANSGRAPLYYKLLGIPGTLAAFENDKVRVDTLANVKSKDVVRAGFDNSAVSSEHRIIERHDSPDGVLWRSYEFGSREGRRHIFDNPFGPGISPNGHQGSLNENALTPPWDEAEFFVPDGGEFIFSLPNGMLGFYIAGRDRQTINEAPVEEGKDPIRAGMTCMGCHVRGFIMKEDQVVARAEDSRRFGEGSSLSLLKDIYVPRDELSSQMTEDSAEYREAIEAAGVDWKGRDPVTWIGEKYQINMNLAQMAADLGVERSRVSDVIGSSFDRLVQQAERGRLSRQEFEETLPEIVPRLSGKVD